MKKIIGLSVIFLIIAAGTIFVMGQEKKADELKDYKDKISYSMGLDVGTYFKSMSDEIDIPSLIKGIQDSFFEKKPLLSAEEVLAIQKEFSEKMQVSQQKELEEMREKNKKEGKAFLEKNKEKAGVTVTESGLQLELLKKGDGPRPKKTDSVKVDYIGKLIDGTEFDNSSKHGEPVILTVDQVIPAWSEGLQLMEVGSKIRLVVPSELAYGETGAAPVIEPNSVLIFEIELHSIEEQETSF